MFTICLNSAIPCFRCSLNHFTHSVFCPGKIDHFSGDDDTVFADALANIGISADDACNTLETELLNRLKKYKPDQQTVKRDATRPVRSHPEHFRAFEPARAIG